MSLSWCGEAIEGSFGPVVNDCRGGFDFTVYFEQLVLSIIPSTTFLVLAAFRIYNLYGASPKARGGWILPLKILFATTYTALQIYLLVRWCKSAPFNIRTSVASAALCVASGMGMLILSALEHLRSTRPSTILQIYLLLTLLFDIAICRTLWLTGKDIYIERVFTSAILTKFVLFCLEVFEKRRWLKPAYSHLRSEALGGFVNLSVFWWLNDLFLIGYKKILVLADIEGVAEAHRAEALERTFKENWSRAPREKPHALLYTIAWTLRWSLAASVFPRICLIGFKFSQPFLIGRLIQYIDSPLMETNVGNGLIGAYALAYSGVAVSTGIYWYQAYRTITMVRGSLIAVIYSRTLNLALSTHYPSAPSALMSVDVERICTCLINLHELWANILEVGIAIYILERKIGAACISPAILALACGFGTLLLTSRIGIRQEAWLKAVQNRLRATESTLGSIKGIKMMGLTKTLAKVIQDMRVRELSLAMSYRILQITSIIISLAMNITGPALTFTTFTIISAVKGSGTLLAAPAFTSITVLGLVGSPLITLFQALPLFRSAVGSMTRIQDFINQPAREDSRQQGTISPSKSYEFPLAINKNDASFPMATIKSREIAPILHEEDLVVITNASIVWANSKDVVLHNINVKIKHNSLTFVIGPVGCGKSTLIKAVLGETRIIDGSIAVSCSDIAFCDQSPWLTYGTIRENITGVTNSTFDEVWYATVIHACALEKDLEQLPAGDQSMIGSKGIAISGGQRQRLSIARAVYSRKRVAIFDDVLSGLDINTEEQVFMRVFGPDGLLQKHDITAILVTHRVHRLPFSSHIIALDETGKVAQQGNFESLNSIDGYVRSLMIRVGGGTEPEIATKQLPSPVRRIIPSPNLDRVDDLTRQTGDISVYKYYLGYAGIRTLYFALVILALYSFCLVFPTIWLDWWSTANERRPGENLGMYLGIYILLGALGLVALSVFCWQMIIVMAPRAGRKLHSTVLEHALWAPLSYLTQTDLGIIMNRFSQDIQLIDFQVTLTSMSAAEALSTTIVRLLVVCATAKYVAAIIPFTLGVVYVIQNGYLRTSRQLRYLDIEAKAPIYTLFVETLEGLATIRAFGWKDPLQRRNHLLVDGAQKPFHLLNCIQRWLGFVLDMLLAVVSVLVVVFAVKFKSQTTGASTGVALVNVLACHQHLAGFVQRWAMLETSIGAVSRIRAFAIECPIETRQNTMTVPPKWPTEGKIEFINISASYSPGSLVLRNVTISIPPGLKIGICGRSGSGKSSFILCLLQMLDISDGKITIDGIDLAQCSQDIVRSAFITLPQDPVILEGSIRFNLDPQEFLSDAIIEVALRKVHLWDVVNQNNGLNASVDSMHFSHGQRQLFVLARAILSKGKILILDEAVSSVDRETNQLVQSLIRSEFASHTVICVEHHLENVLTYDKIAVFDGGSLVEFDSPDTLLQVNSRFKRMVEA